MSGKVTAGRGAGNDRSPSGGKRSTNGCHERTGADRRVLLLPRRTAAGATVLLCGREQHRHDAPFASGARHRDRVHAAVAVRRALVDVVVEPGKRDASADENVRVMHALDPRRPRSLSDECDDRVDGGLRALHEVARFRRPRIPRTAGTKRAPYFCPDIVPRAVTNVRTATLAASIAVRMSSSFSGSGENAAKTLSRPGAVSAC